MDIILCSLRATLTVVVVCSTSIWLSRRNVITPEIIKGLSVLVFNLFNPCLIFFNIGPSVTVATLLQWWPIPAYCVLYIVVGCGLGMIISNLLGLTDSQRRFTMACLSFANTTSIPLAITQSIMLTNWNIFQTSAAAAESQDRISRKAISYIMFMTVFQTACRWTVGYRLFAAAAAATTTSSDSSSQTSATTSRSQPSVGNGPQRNGDYLKVPIEAVESTTTTTTTTTVEGISSNLPLELPTSITTATEPPLRTSFEDPPVPLLSPPPLLWDRLQTFVLSVKEYMNPPLLGCVAAITVGIIPPLKLIAFDTSSSFLAQVLMQAGKSIGGCAVPVILIILGGHLRNGPEQGGGTDNIPKLLLPTIIATKLVLIPFLFFTLIVMMRKFQLMTSDPVMALTLLLCNVGPTAINLLVIATQQNTYVKTTATLHFYAYLMSNLTTTAWVICFLWYLQ